MDHRACPATSPAKRLAEMKIVLTKQPYDVILSATIPLGTLKLGRPQYAAALKQLDRGVLRLKDLVDGPAMQHDLGSILMQTDWAHPAKDTSDDYANALRFNQIISSSPDSLLRYNFFASPVTGGGVFMSLRHRLAWAAVEAAGTEESEIVEKSYNEMLSDPVYEEILSLDDSVKRGFQEWFPDFLWLCRKLGICSRRV